jgi:hypothetical protein
MRNPLFYFVGFVMSSCFVKSKTVDSIDTYFVKNKMYHYNTLYIDSEGDTIIKGQLTIQPIDKPWIFQRKLQESVNYIYFNDTAEYYRYKDPELSFFLDQQKYFQRRRRLKMHVKENTGGYYNESAFYLHPPRSNQFRMLYYAAHPYVRLGRLQDSVTQELTTLKIYGMGTVMNEYRISPLEASSLQSVEREIEVWGIDVISEVEYTNDYFKQLKIFNSTLDAEFCKEFGFIKMHYTFENGIKIQMDFVKMTEE